MIIDKDEIISELELKPFGQKGWYRTSAPCPYCGKSGEKSGVLFTNDSAVFHCFRCGTKTSIYNYLVQVGRKDLARHGHTLSNKSAGLLPLKDDEVDEDSEEVKDVVLPSRLVRLEHDPYLDSRHFMPSHYDEFEPSESRSFLEKDLMKYHYIIFKLKQGDHVVAWLARSRFSKQWHDENHRAHKEGKAHLVLRYRNSTDGFSHVLGGYNYINLRTDTVILVEGLFDKVNIDYLLQLGKGDDICCCFTFGKKISPGQIKLLRGTSVKHVILMYDEDALVESKESAFILKRFFDVKVCRIKDKNVDPGNMTAEYLDNVLSLAVDPLNFYLNNMEGIVNNGRAQVINI